MSETQSKPTVKVWAWTAIFITTMYFAFTYNNWDWWIKALIVFSVLAIWGNGAPSIRATFKRTSA